MPDCDCPQVLDTDGSVLPLSSDNGKLAERPTSAHEYRLRRHAARRIWSGGANCPVLAYTPVSGRWRLQERGATGSCFVVESCLCRPPCHPPLRAIPLDVGVEIPGPKNLLAAARPISYRKSWAFRSSESRSLGPFPCRRRWCGRQRRVGRGTSGRGNCHGSHHCLGEVDRDRKGLRDLVGIRASRELDAERRPARKLGVSAVEGAHRQVRKHSPVHESRVA